jgi:hypothetical protein
MGFSYGFPNFPWVFLWFSYGGWDAMTSTRPGYVIQKANWKMEVLYGFIWFYGKIMGIYGDTLW